MNTNKTSQELDGVDPGRIKWVFAVLEDGGVPSAGIGIFACDAEDGKDAPLLRYTANDDGTTGRVRSIDVRESIREFITLWDLWRNGECVDIEQGELSDWLKDVEALVAEKN